MHKNFMRPQLEFGGKKIDYDSGPWLVPLCPVFTIARKGSGEWGGKQKQYNLFLGGSTK